MSNIGNQPLKDVFQQLLQISSSGEIADATGSGQGIFFDGDGGLTAKTYTISSSVSVINFIQESGSTAFGNTADDTHTIIGHITASGNISASGDLVSAGIYLDGVRRTTWPAASVGDWYDGSTYQSSSMDIYVEGDISSSGHLYVGTGSNAYISIGGGNFSSASLAAGGGSSEFTAAGISGSLGANAALIRTLTAVGISGSLGSNATLIRSLDASGISGSLGSNAALIRSLDASGISGSWQSITGSFASGFDVAGILGATGSYLQNADTGSMGNLTVSGGISASGDLYLAGGDIYSNTIVMRDLEGYSYISASGTSSTRKVELGDLSPAEGNTTKLVIEDDHQKGYIIAAVSNPKFGIGNTAPPKELTVKGDISASGEFFTQGSASIGFLPISHSGIPDHGLLVSGSISASGDVYLKSGAKIYYYDENQYIVGTATGITLETDDKFLVHADTHANIDTPKVGIGYNATTPPKTLTVEGDISASGDLFVSRSFINTINTGSGLIPLIVEGDISASGNYYSGTNKLVLSSQTGSFITNISNLTTKSGSWDASGSLAQNLTTKSGSWDYIIDTSGSFAVTGSDVIFNHITASGNISASGKLYVTGDVDFDGTLKLGDLNDVSSSLAAAVAGGDNLGNHTAIQDLNLSGNDIYGVQHITASGNISASGYISADSFVGDGAGLTGLSSAAISSVANFGDNNRVITAAGAAAVNAETNLTFDGDNLKVVGSITASGDISASGIIYGDGFTSNGANIGSNTGGEVYYGTGVLPSIYLSSDHYFYGHITASGNISASGLLYVSSSDGVGITQVALIDTGSGLLYYTASSAIGGGSGTGFPFSGSAVITGSMFISGSESDEPLLTVEGDISASGDLFAMSGSFGGITDPVSLLEVRGPEGTGAGSAGILTLSTTETSVDIGDYLGQINFQAPKESGGSDAIVPAASIHAENAVLGFTATFNNTDLVFSTNVSEALPTERMRITGGGGGGRVGIGNSFPPKKLTVEGSISSSDVFYLNDTSAQIKMGDNVAGSHDGIAVKGDISASGDLSVQSHITASGNISASATSTGSFGRVTIGNAVPAPSMELTVKGDISASNFIYSGQDFISTKNDRGWKTKDSQGNSYYALRKNTFDKLIIGISNIGHQTIIRGDNTGLYLSGSRVGIETPEDKIPKTLTVAGDISASGDLYMSGSTPAISSSGVHYGKQFYYTHHISAWTNANENYIPMNHNNEGPSINYIRQFIAPFSGELKRVLVYAENNPGSTVVKLWKNGAEQDTDTETMSATTTATFNFSSSFSSGDLLSISIDPTLSPQDVNTTCVWVYDTTT